MQLRDPLIEPGDQEQLDRLEDDAREQRWADFESFIWEAKVPTVLHCIAYLMEGLELYTDASIAVRILAFQETEGWSGVLSAIARTLHQAKK